jgi:hypothetical protein
MDSAVSSVLAAQDASTADRVGYTVLRKAMDAQQQEGAQIVDMIKQAADAGQQASARASGSGAGTLDTYA